MSVFLNPWVLLLLVLTSLVSGLAVSWVHRSRAKQRAQLEAQRHRAREEIYHQTERTVVQQGQELSELRRQAQADVERRAAAETRAYRVDQLEEEAQRREAQSLADGRERGTLLAEIAKLETRIEEERRSSKDQIRVLTEARESLTQSFQALSAEALAQSNRSFLDLARETLERYQVQAQSDLKGRQTAVEHLVLPIRESLSQVDKHLRKLETARQEAYGGLRQQMEDLTKTQVGLRQETQKLSQALRSPNVRGRWGGNAASKSGGDFRHAATL